MSALRVRIQRELQGLVPSPARVDFLLTRMRSGNVSRRQIAALTGIQRSKIHSILHSEHDKRGPMKIDEWHAILGVLAISHLEATIAVELIESDSTLNVDVVSSISEMLAELVRGLPMEMIDMVRHIDGLHHGDVRPEHGGTVRKLLIQFLRNHYQELVTRRDIREGSITRRP